MQYVKQISNDSLLNIYSRHEHTCPLINVLQFRTDSSSKLYEDELDYDPIHLKVNPKRLITSINDLDKWATGILEIYDSLPKDIQIKSGISIDDYRDMLETKYNNEIKNQSKSINKIVEAWTINRNEYKEILEKHSILENDINKKEKEIIIKKMAGESIVTDIEEINILKNSIIEINTKVDEQLLNFEKNIKNQFIKETKDFSEFLEVVRERNEDLRESADNLKELFFNHAKEILNIYQPDEYLDRNFSVSSKKIFNLGVLFNDSDIGGKTETSNFRVLTNGLLTKRILNFDEVEMCLTALHKPRIERKNVLFKMLRIKGFDEVRYYETQDDYLRDKDKFSIETLKVNKLENKSKNKLNP